MSELLNITQLMDWLEGRLPDDKAGSVASAVQADASLTATVNWLRAFVDFGKSTVLVEPPDELSREAVSYFHTSSQSQRQTGWLQRLVATLTSDSWQRPSLVGVRYAGLKAAPRQLVYEAATADIVLNIHAETTGNTFNIIGQVFPIDGAAPDSFTVQLIRQDLEAAYTYTNEVGKFTFTDVSGGAYTIVIRGDQAEIIISDIEVSV